MIKSHIVPTLMKSLEQCHQQRGQGQQNQVIKDDQHVIVK